MLKHLNLYVLWMEYIPANLATPWTINNFNSEVSRLGLYSSYSRKCGVFSQCLDLLCLHNLFIVIDRLCYVIDINVFQLFANFKPLKKYKHFLQTWTKTTLSFQNSSFLLLWSEMPFWYCNEIIKFYKK